jgi:hypothetical protein
MTVKQGNEWVVQIAEIERISPRVKSGAFVVESKDLKRMIASQIMTKPELHHWFNVPYVKVDYKSIAAKVLCEELPSKIYVDEQGGCLKKTPGALVTNVEGESLEATGVDVAWSLRDEFHKEEVRDAWDD